MNTTVRMKASDIAKDWHVIDAAGRPLGRVASEAATLLMGKHKPTWEPHLDDGDFVIIINAGQVVVTGNKAAQIKYRTHSGYPGGLRTRTYAEQFSRFPDRVLEKAVWGMLPDGPLGKAILKHLKVYRGSNHPHASQVTGSERAKVAREADREASMTVTRTPPRLRPLGGVTPALPALTEFEDIAPAAPAGEPAAPMVPPLEPVSAAEAPAEAVVQAAGPAGEPQVEVLAPGVEPEAEPEAEPKPRARRRSAATTETAAEASIEPAADTSEEPKKPARRRAAKTED